MSWSEYPSKPRDMRGWKQQRNKALIRDSHECQLRYAGCTGRATEVDHIINVARGGGNELENLMSVCKRCHGRKTQQEAAKARTAWKRKPEVPPWEQ